MSEKFTEIEYRVHELHRDGTTRTVSVASERARKKIHAENNRIKREWRK